MAFRNDEELERYLNNMVEDDDSETEPLEAEEASENEDNVSVHSEQDDIISGSDEDDVPQLRGSVLKDQLLKEYRLTCIGTLRKNKREIPPAFLPNKSKSALSSQFAFDREKTLVSFTPKHIPPTISNEV
ncbi:unnamed protein product [Parnassius apollo]|uniref:(apollo) hypothetical protein n=1 Tax=Parnassius apollo TaxID=110799 RepID=A0A8S3WTL4_PARAO|nr:unnamed protein product [Parnassius apollo]